MLRLRKNSSSSSSTVQAQSAIEYLLLLSVVTAIVLVAFNQNYLTRVYNAANLYFDRAAVGIYGNAASCGDKICQPFENHTNCPKDCLPVAEPIVPIQCTQRDFYSGTCPQAINIGIFNNGETKSGDCPPSCNELPPNQRKWEITCVNNWIVQNENKLCYPTGDAPPPPDTGLPCAPPNIHSIGCPADLNIGALSHNQTVEVPNCPAGCSPTNPETKIYATCYNGNVSVLGTCSGGGPPDLSCPAYDYYYSGNGCKGLIQLGQGTDGQFTVAECPTGCSGDQIRVMCEKGTFSLDVTTINCKAVAAP